MFNSTERHYHTHNVNIEERRAPTDDSVRLLKELEQKALDKIIGTFDLPSNEIKSRVAVSKDYLNGKNLFCVVADINGKRHVVHVSADDQADRKTQLEQIYNELSEKIAQIIMPSVFDVGFGNKFF